MSSTWKDSPHSDVGYIVVMDNKIVAWCEWYAATGLYKDRPGKWHVVEPFHVKGANGREYVPTVSYDA